MITILDDLIKRFMRAIWRLNDVALTWAMSTSTGSASLNARGKMAGPKAFHLEARSPVAWGRLFVNTSVAHTPACILGSNMPQKLL